MVVFTSPPPSSNPMAHSACASSMAFGTSSYRSAPTRNQGPLRVCNRKSRCCCDGVHSWVGDEDVVLAVNTHHTHMQTSHQQPTSNSWLRGQHRDAGNKCPSSRNTSLMTCNTSCTYAARCNVLPCACIYDIDLQHDMQHAHPPTQPPA